MDKPKCQYCGKPLTPNLIREEKDHKGADWYKQGQGKKLGVEGYGYNNNGFFCTLRCGFKYAVGLLKKTKTI